MSGVRLLRLADVPEAMRLKEAAGWNQTEQDWRRILDLQPDGCFGIEQDGRLVATTTTICYGRRLAWIGMVLTDPEFRGRGFASQLMRHALEYLDNRGMEWIKLDATDMGKDLYRKFGFAEERPIERWRGAGPWPAAPGLIPAPVRESKPDPQQDLKSFGADRSRLLDHLAAGESACIDASGYVMGRPGSNAAYFGPCIAASPENARSLLEWFLARHHAEPVYWDLLPENREAAQLAEEFGFKRVRRLVRMARGQAHPLRTNVGEIYAIAGFEFG